MAALALTDYSFTAGGTDLSAWVQSITLSTSANLLDASAMGTTNIARVAGQTDTTVSVVFVQDFAAGGPDATLGGNEGSSFALVMLPTSGSVGATNPSYSVTCLLESYDPTPGTTVGALATATATFQGNGALVRATS